MIVKAVDSIVIDKIVVIRDDVSWLFSREKLLKVFFFSTANNGGGGSRDNKQGNDFGFGYPRTRDDRTGGGGGGGGGRDYNRQGQRNRYQDDDNRPSGGIDRPRYGGRFSDTR